MKILTILGTRPEIIRLCLVIPKLDKYCEQILVHTNQNYDPELDKIFFEELEVRQPNYNLNCKGTFSEQIGTILVELEKIVNIEKPDKFLVLGDTNSSMAAIVMKRLGIKVYHMEAGNRCFDPNSPEEVNRKIIDHCTDVHMPYTYNSRNRLIAEGISLKDIYVVGNPITEVIHRKFREVSWTEGEDKTTTTKIHNELKLSFNGYFLVTMHRQENVDPKNRLKTFIDTFHELYDQYKIPVIISAHPRLRKRIEEYNINIDQKKVRLYKPFNLTDFITLERKSACVLSDSGTVQEECCILGVPSVIIRERTERPETIESGATIVTGCDKERILNAVNMVMKERECWKPPEEYQKLNVSDTVCKILLSN